jgi:hypothetical protein
LEWGKHFLICFAHNLGLLIVCFLSHSLVKVTPIYRAFSAPSEHESQTQRKSRSLDAQIPKIVGKKL